MEAGLMDAAPVWTDLKTFPWAEFRDRVDILTGGYPCQPFSSAGKRLGAEDPRHLWPYIADGIRLLRPRVCFFENVEGHISLGLREVIRELEKLGYATAWGIFSASECGAPHQRKRVFIFAANADGSRIQGHRFIGFAQKAGPGRASCQASCNSEFASIDWQSEIKRGLVRADDGGAAWVDRVRLLGNGVVPATAALAFETLLNEICTN